MDNPHVSEETSARMRSVGRFDTAAEMKLRRALWRSKLRYRVHYRVAGARPDVAFPGSRVAVFVDGCFWHGCPEHYVAPVQNREFWRRKLERVRARDRRNDAALQEAGWKVLRFWEHEVDRDLGRVVETIRSTLGPHPTSTRRKRG